MNNTISLTKLHHKLVAVTAERDRLAAELALLREENEKLWMTFVKTADVLGIDTEAERKTPGAPSGVFIREIERLRKDAERYRWLRDAGATFYTGGPEITDGSDKVHVCEFAMDSAIDASRGGSSQAQNTQAQNGGGK